MTALILALLLVQAAPGPKGVATGIVRSSTGSPASGIRVYAVPAGDPNAAATGSSVFESLAQTDASGHYRLEVPAGRYYIAVGSVTSPTYFPDTTDISSARAISIAAGTMTANIDFSRYTVSPPSPIGVSIFSTLFQLPPGSTGVLSGVVRAADGSPVSGFPVRIISVALLSNPLLQPSGMTETDRLGRYRLENVTPDSYQILAGYSDFPIFYPGEADIQKAVTITTTPATQLTNLDIALPMARKTFSIRGQVLGRDRTPGSGLTVSIERISPLTNPVGIAYLPDRTYRYFNTGGDGRYVVADTVPGQYALQVQFPGMPPLRKIVNILNSDVDVDFDAADVPTGRIILDNAVPGPQFPIAEVAARLTPPIVNLQRQPARDPK